MIAIILVNWNGKADTLVCLESLARLDDKNFRIIICDNCSDDGSAGAFLAWGARYGAGAGRVALADMEKRPVARDQFLTIVDVGANLGFAGAINVGIRLALADPLVRAVWLLNNDTSVDAQALPALRSRMAQDPEIGICGSTLICFNDRQKVQTLGVRYTLGLGRGHQIGAGRTLGSLPAREKVERAMTYVCGASMLVAREFIETVGLMEERYFLYFEELDWVLRNKARFKLGWAPGSVVFHKAGASTGSARGGRPSDLTIYYQNVNLLRIAARFRPHFLPLIFARLTGLFARYLWRRDPAGAYLVARAMGDFFARRTRGAGAWVPPRPSDNEAT
ncbi:MAG: glycosyltransferase family 2 protein [Alphaproteobacteria bacterium]